MEDNKGKKIEINSSSLIDLKAELFRKQEEFRQQKLKSAGTGHVKGRSAEKSKPTFWSKKNAGVLERAQQDLEVKQKEENLFDRSRKALETKAKLYDTIATSASITEHDGSGMFLVDFQKKAIDKIVEKRENERKRQDNLTSEVEKLDEEEDKLSLMEDIPPPSDPGEEWVDYTDSLGRSRRCMKKDLPQIQKQDKELFKFTRETSEERTAGSTNPTLLSDDIRREMLRQKWEKEELEMMGQPVHYANVQFDEIRNHGVGYYQFAKSEETRQEQMDMLNKLRDQTVDERSRRERLREKRKAMLDARLAKVKQRRKMKGGLVGMDESKVEDDEEEIGPKIEERSENEKWDDVVKRVEPELLTRDDEWRKMAPVREWDKGKDKLPQWSREKYIQERRAERENEFAPPSLYFQERESEKVKIFPALSPNLTQHSADQSKVNKSHKEQNDNEVQKKEKKNEKGTNKLGKEQTEKIKDNKTNAVETTSSLEDISSIPLPPEASSIVGQSEPMQPPLNSEWVFEAPRANQSASYFPEHLPSKQINPMFVPPPQINTQHVGYTVDWYSSQNISIPPGCHQSGAPLQCGVTGTDRFQSVSVAQSVTSIPAGFSQQNNDQASETLKLPQSTVTIPRMTIVDTRFIQNEDTSGPDISDYSVPDTNIHAVPYQPGSFTAALNASQQETEKIILDSRKKAHYSGSPVVYKPERAEETSCPVSCIETDSCASVPCESSEQKAVEDTVDAFLRSLRNSK